MTVLPLHILIGNIHDTATNNTFQLVSWSVGLLICLSICLSVCLSVFCLSSVASMGMLKFCFSLGYNSLVK